MSAKSEDSFTLSCEVSDFAEHPHLNGLFWRSYRWADLLWAVTTVGKWRTDLARFGHDSAAEALHRIFCMDAYLEIRDSQLAYTRAHQALDPSEKAVVSYYLGMAMAKLWVSSELSIPWLMHISRYGARWAPTYASASRPDLFGFNSSGDWAVVEAKGRNRVTQGLRARMKSQKSAVASIDGVPPAYRLGVATRFPERRLALVIVDPPVAARAQDLPISIEDWLVDYYAPIIDLIRGSDSRRVEDRVVTILRGSSIEIGVDTEIVEAVDELRQRSTQRPRTGRPRTPTTEPRPRRPILDEVAPRDREAILQIQIASSRGRERLSGQPDGLIFDTPR